MSGLPLVFLRTVLMSLLLALVFGLPSAVASVGAAALTPAPVPGSFVSMTPARVFDTRSPWSSTVSGPVAAHRTIHVTVSGNASWVPAGATAVVMNVTVTQPTKSGNIAVYPDLTPEPVTSNVNFVQGQTIPNLVVVGVGADGKIALTNNSPGTVELIADVSGYYLGGGAPSAPGAFESLGPLRMLDTRHDEGAFGPVAAHGTVHLQITGGVVPAGSSAVVVNVTVTRPAAAGNVTVYPDLTPEPLASNVNFVQGQTIPNLAEVAIGPDGKIALTNNSNSSVQLIADVSGYYLGGGPATSPGTFVPKTPLRILDTRHGIGSSGPVNPYDVAFISPSSAGLPSNVTAVVMNVTATQPTKVGYLRVTPDPSESNASSLNFVAGQTIPNLAVVAPGSTSEIAVENHSPGTVQLIADLFGYFIGGPTPGVTDLTVVQDSPQLVYLTWMDPTPHTYTDVIVRRATGTQPPASPTAGAQVGDSYQTDIVDQTVSPSTTYSYSLFTHYPNGAYSDPVSITVTTPA